MVSQKVTLVTQTIVYIEKGTMRGEKNKLTSGNLNCSVHLLSLDSTEILYMSILLLQGE